MKMMARTNRPRSLPQIVMTQVIVTDESILLQRKEWPVEYDIALG